MSSADRFAGIRHVLRYRKAIEALAAGLPVLAGLWIAWRSGWPECVVAGLVAAPCAWFGMRVLIEVIDVVAETLLPR